jgi:hypothetical protein
MFPSIIVHILNDSSHILWLDWKQSVSIYIVNDVQIDVYTNCIECIGFNSIIILFVVIEISIQKEEYTSIFISTKSIFNYMRIRMCRCFEKTRRREGEKARKRKLTMSLLWWLLIVIVLLLYWWIPSNFSEESKLTIIFVFRSMTRFVSLVLIYSWLKLVDRSFSIHYRHKQRNAYDSLTR